MEVQLLNIMMVGINYRTADIRLREKISFTSLEVRKLLNKIKSDYDIEGSVIISTCNRTELYISYPYFKNEEEIEQMFCQVMNISPEEVKEHFYFKNNDEVPTYLFELACGIHSMIFGEDQIVSQVKEAISLANEEESSNSTLNTLFRYAITCAKKVKSNVLLKSLSPSVAKQAVDILVDYISETKTCKALVIGNGEVGRDVCEELVLKGCEVYMTLRLYKHSKPIIPNGCKTVDYEKRAELLSSFDILVSATKSPHHTITYEMLFNSIKKPKYIIDLAVPRDIDPKIEEIEDINYLNVDSIGKTALRDNSKEIKIIQGIIDEQINKFYEWRIIHKSYKDMEDIKEIALRKVIANINDDFKEEEKLKSAIIKTIDLIVYSLKESSSRDIVGNIKEALLMRR